MAHYGGSLRLNGSLRWPGATMIQFPQLMNPGRKRLRFPAIFCQFFPEKATHSPELILIFFQTEWNMIVVTVFLLILNQMAFYLARKRLHLQPNFCQFSPEMVTLVFLSKFSSHRLDNQSQPKRHFLTQL